MSAGPSGGHGDEGEEGGSADLRVGDRKSGGDSIGNSATDGDVRYATKFSLLRKKETQKGLEDIFLEFRGA